MLYAGLDLSRQRLDVHVLDEDGSTVEVTAVRPDADALRTLAAHVLRHGQEDGGTDRHRREGLALPDLRRRPGRVIRPPCARQSADGGCPRVRAGCGVPSSIRQQRVSVRQDKAFGPIWIVLLDPTPLDQASFESVESEPDVQEQPGEKEVVSAENPAAADNTTVEPEQEGTKHDTESETS